MTYHEDELTRPVTVVELPDFVRDAMRGEFGLKPSDRNLLTILPETQKPGQLSKEPAVSAKYDGLLRARANVAEHG